MCMYNGIIIANSNSGCRIGMSVTGVAAGPADRQLPDQSFIYSQ